MTTFLGSSPAHRTAPHTSVTTPPSGSSTVPPSGI
uniref:Uncharacterized protein n=1 Tax=Nymphaea colorata TaxID=210225 RepID=A0A5K1FJ24_9MAGN